MGKSITTKNVKKPSGEKLSKPKKNAGSISKKERKSELEELKQLLNLEKPKINLSMFDNLNLQGADTPKKLKKSGKKRRFLKL